jgi:hypothetical protein
VTKEVEVNGWYNGEVEVRGGWKKLLH